MPGRPRSTLLDREELISPRRMRMFFDRYYVTGQREEDEWRYWSELSLGVIDCGDGSVLT